MEKRKGKEVEDDYNKVDDELEFRDPEIVCLLMMVFCGFIWTLY